MPRASSLCTRPTQIARTGGPARGGSTETAVPRLPLAESLCSSRWLWRGLRGHALRDDLVVQLADIRVKRGRLDLLRRGDQRLVPEALPVGFGLPDVRDPPAPILARPSERRNHPFRRIRRVWDYTLHRSVVEVLVPVRPLVNDHDRHEPSLRGLLSASLAV